MRKPWILAGMAGLFAMVFAAPAAAHPHVWVTGRTEVVFSGGEVTALKHRWTFDELFSTMASQGLDTDGDGTLTREELAPLAEINVTSLREFAFFTFLGDDTQDGGEEGEAPFEEPVDYWLDFADDKLTLNFTLPLKDPVAVGESMNISVYDPSYYVAFAFAKDAPLSLAGAPEQCAAGLERGDGPDISEAAPGLLLSKPDFIPSPDFAAQFAQTVTIACD